MAQAAAISVRQGVCDEESLRRIQRLIAKAGLPTAIPPDIKLSELVKKMEGDKKASGGELASAGKVHRGLEGNRALPRAESKASAGHPDPEQAPVSGRQAASGPGVATAPGVRFGRGRRVQNHRYQPGKALSGKRCSDGPCLCYGEHGRAFRPAGLSFGGVGDLPPAVSCFGRGEATLGENLVSERAPRAGGLTRCAYAESKAGAGTIGPLDSRSAERGIDGEKKKNLSAARPQPKSPAPALLSA